jgi:hypothetical protein
VLDALDVVDDVLLFELAREMVELSLAIILEGCGMVGKGMYAFDILWRQMYLSVGEDVPFGLLMAVY